MAQSYEFYTARADEARKAADAATLDNVRNRELRAAKSWLDLAEHARGVAEAREKVEREKREAREAEAQDA
ncbi:hypothetical protein [Qipengyuania vesicularis]|uniref:hypothetical protein n=1 Tax=Qipengyuania vesicularis TaxID=2867232 RepID=UPI001C86921A|nr:hypothetical protein [Qipengyuania vesicularis]MBX7528559.1 hypothetical protein [Qipengyuania vesicularis]